MKVNQAIERFHGIDRLVAREQDRPDIRRHRERWRLYQGLIDPSRLVFIDETWTKTNMTRFGGWAQKGKRLVDKVPHGHWKTATFLAALRNDRIEAPCLIDGSINGECFQAYVEQFLVPTLKPGDVVILGNLGSHNRKAVRTAIRRIGARLVFLPKDSPDLSPIEQVFAKLKSFVRKQAQGPSTPSPTPSPTGCKPSHQTDALIISPMPGMLQAKCRRL